MSNIKNLVKAASDIVILTHISEDADTLGSAAALKYALSDMGKKAHIYIEDETENRLKFMDNGCYRVYGGETLPKYDLCICVDCGDLARLGKRIELFNGAVHTINIDHHITNTLFAEENLVDAQASSAGEIVYGVIKNVLGQKITDTIAFCLYIAIASDSGCFKYSSVSPKTMRVAADLLETGIDHAKICRKLFDTEEKNVLRMKGYVMENIREYADGKICVVSLDRSILESYGVSEKDTGDTVNIARTVRGCEIAVSIREAEDKVKISLRSNGKYDVSKIAVQLGGGGHKMAAGISLENVDAAEAERIIIQNCIKAIKGTDE